METEIFCPIGKKCQEAKDGKVYQCNWFRRLVGMHPQTGEQIDEWDCAIGWVPLLMVEMSKTNRGQTAAIESFRNETVKRQDAFLGLANDVSQKRIK